MLAFIFFLWQIKEAGMLTLDYLNKIDPIGDEQVSFIKKLTNLMHK